MTRPELPDTPRRPTRRQALTALVAAAGLAGGVAVTSGGGAGAADAVGPIATAAARALRVVDAEGGTLGRADTTTVVYDGTGGRVGGGPAGSFPVEGASTGTPTIANLTPVAAQVCPATTTASTSSTSSTSSTTSTTVPGSSTTTSTVPCPTSTTSTSSTTTSTTPPPTTPPPTTTAPLPDERAEPSAAERGGPVVGGPSSEGLDAEDVGGTGDPSATLTALLAIGEPATRGSVLYRADDEPIVALLAPDPLFRDLSTDSDDGPDVQAVEANLVELGFGAGLTVDEHFDGDTAAAVMAWEEALGRQDPDGAVAVGEVVLLEEVTAVLGHEAAVGDLLQSGDAVLELGAESRVVETDVLAEEAADWPVGTSVELDWGDGTTATGSVVEVSRDVIAGEVALVVVIGEGGGADRPIGSAVEVRRTVAEREAALAVPVAAVVAGPDGPAVRVVGGGEDQLVPVELGLVDDGWVEVRSGTDAGTEVRLPA